MTRRLFVCYSPSMAQTPTVTIRAGITDAEHDQLRKLAIDQGRRVSALVADALRAAYPLTPAKGKR